MSATRGAIGWGVALLVLGVALLLRALEVVGPTAGWPWAMLAAGVVLLGHPASRRAGALATPVVLTLVGALFVVRDLGGLPGGIPVVPLLLVIAGVALLAGSLGQQVPLLETETVEVGLDGDGRSRLVLSHGAGTLRVSGGAAAELLCQGTARGGVVQDRRRVAGRSEVTLRPATDVERLLRHRRPIDWDLRLSAQHATDLEVRTGASRVHLDLTGTAVDRITVKTGASDVDILLPAGRSCEVDVDAGAAEVDVWVPQDVAADVRIDSALASVDVDPRRFPKSGDRHRSPDFEQAEHRATITIEGGVASFTVR